MNGSMNFWVGDLAYDFGPCSDLARGVCSNAEDGVPCWSVLSLVNVDTLSWIINGKRTYRFLHSVTLLKANGRRVSLVPRVHVAWTEDPFKIKTNKINLLSGSHQTGQKTAFYTFMMSE